MKKRHLFLSFALSLTGFMASAQTAISTDNTNDNPRGILDLTNSNNKREVFPMVFPAIDNENLVVNPNGQNPAVGSVFFDKNEKVLKVYVNENSANNQTPGWRIVSKINYYE